MYSSEQSFARDITSGGRADTDLGGFLSILRRYKLSISIMAAGVLLLILAYLAVTPSIYTATATLFIDPRARKIVSDDVVVGGLTSDAALVESQVPIITSESVLGRAVDALALDKDPAIATPPRGGFVSNLKDLVRGPRPEVEPKTRALEALARTVRVKRASKTYVVDIEVDNTSAAKASAIANAIATAYIDAQMAFKADEAHRVNKAIDARLGELGEQVRKAETRIDEFKKANHIVTSEGGVVTEQQLGKLNSELASARAVAAEAKARYEQATEATKGRIAPDSLADAVKSGLVQKLRDQYAQVARREAALATQLQPRHPVLIDVRSQLKEIEAQISAELKRIAAAARSEFEIASNRERELVRTIETSKEEVGRTGTASIKLRELEREANASRELLQAFLARAKETQEQQNITTAEARIVSPAAVPSYPSKPSRALLAALGLIGGLGLGLAQALVRHHLDRSIHSGGDLSRLTGLKLAGELPYVPPRGLTGRISSWIGAERPSATDPTAYGDLLMAIGDTRGRNAPDYRQGVLRLLSRLRTGVRAGRPLAIMVAGGESGIGTSSVALSLAYAAALAGDRALLVDANSVNPALSGVFGRDVSREAPIALDNKEHLARIVSRDARSGLSLLPVALADIRSLRAQQRRRLVSGLTTMAQDYDLIVYDGGALNEDESALSLVPAVDRIVLVVGAGTSTRDTVADLSVVTEGARNRIAGAVLVHRSA